MTDLEIIDEIEKIRNKNNVNWMDILRLSFKYAPTEARQIMSKINTDDNRISELLEQLSNNG
jgi:predicted transcriptional regulator